MERCDPAPQIMRKKFRFQLSRGRTISLVSGFGESLFLRDSVRDHSQILLSVDTAPVELVVVSV
jgi:hypothetical protein